QPHRRIPEVHIGRQAREGEPGKRRDDYRERILCPSAVFRRLGERSDHVEKLDDGARPSVREQERQCIGALSLPIEEEDIHAITARLDLGVAIYLSFGGPPVELRRPVLAEALQPLDVRTCFPPSLFGNTGRHLPRQPGAPHPLEDGIDTCLRNGHRELPHQVWPGEGRGLLPLRRDRQEQHHSDAENGGGRRQEAKQSRKRGLRMVAIGRCSRYAAFQRCLWAAANSLNGRGGLPINSRTVVVTKALPPCLSTACSSISASASHAGTARSSMALRATASGTST